MQSIAQEPSDAMRYSWFTQQGTARTAATANALTGLGGDLTSIFTNPAGLGMFKTGEFVLTPGLGIDKINANYLGTKETSKDNSFVFGTSGLIIPFNNDYGGKKTRNWTFGVGVNQVANFRGTAGMNGFNNQSSYSEKYLEELINNGVTDPNDAANNFPYGSSLAFNTFLIDTLSGPGGSVTGYRSLATPQTGVNQSQVVNSSGGITDLGLGLAANLSDKFYLGASMSWSFLRYERTSIYREEDATSNTQNNFNYFTTEEYLRTEGTGLNLKLGMIYKPVEYIRLGLSFATPTWYNLEDSYQTTVTTDLEGYEGFGEKFQSSTDFNNGQNGFFEYGFNNPWRAAFGIAYVFREDKDITRQRGFLTADIEWVDYRTNKFNTLDDFSNPGSYFQELNSTMDSYFRGTFNARVGGELKFETIMVRAGFAYFGSPYADEAFSASRMNISGGLGYRNKGKFIDLTYVHQLYKNGYYPYRLDQGFFAPTTLSGGLGSLLLTVGFKF